MIDILTGDARAILPTLPDNHFHTCVTSPPYFGLRDYGNPDQMGLEKTPDAYVAEMVAVLREVRRVLRDDGTLWLNLGDSYASAWACDRRNVVGNGSMENGKRADRPNRLVGGLKEKDLIGIPWRVAFALQADGWYLRQDIVWHKPNPMPESVTDRCTKAHEYLFLLTKSERYHYDHEAIKEPAVSDHPSGNGFKRDARLTYKNPDGTARGNDEQWTQVGGKRNRRSVWTIPTRPFQGAHFATFPPDLIRPCILAGCPVGGRVLDPFGGAGTTGLVAKQENRAATLIELNPEYAAMARARIDSEEVQTRMFG